MLEGSPEISERHLTKYNLEMELLPMLDEVLEADVRRFRSELLPSFYPAFDQMASHEKELIVALDRLSNKELKELARVIAEREDEAKAKNLDSNVVVIGIHDFNNLLTPLEMFRLAKRRKKESDEQNLPTREERLAS